MKQIIHTICTTVPPTALFLIGMIAGVSYGLCRLYAMLQEVGLDG